MPPGIALSISIVTLSDPYLSLSSWAISRKDVPEKFASQPITRSSSAGCPHDSWICSETCEPPRMTSKVPLGHCGAANSARASSPMRAAFSRSAARSTTSHPPLM